MTGHLIMMCGIPGSGKSTFAKQMIENDENIVYISRDVIRFSLIKPNEKYFSKEKEVKQTYFKQLRENLIKGKTVIADATHLSPKSRQALISGIGYNKMQVTAVWFDVPLEVCLKRNSQRAGRERVPEKTITDMFYNKQKPIKTVERYIHRIITVDENFNVIQTDE